MDLSQYTQFKTQNLMSIIVKNNQIFITQKKFDPNTGTVLADQVQPIDINYIKNQITFLQSQLTNYQLLLADLNTVKIGIKALT